MTEEIKEKSLIFQFLNEYTGLEIFLIVEVLLPSESFECIADVFHTSFNCSNYKSKVLYKYC